jgi:hypothetical protein
MKARFEKIENFFRSIYNKFLIRKIGKTHLNQTSLKSQHKLVIAILLFGCVAFIWERNKTVAPPQVEEMRKSVDTFIPIGFVLVPIQLANAESLDSMIGSSGVVDLFVPDMKKPGRSKKVAEHIKILRAPLNPNQFAVLVSEKNSGQLVHYEGAYFAVVQNPRTPGTQIENHSPHKLPSRLTMEDVGEFR